MLAHGGVSDLRTWDRQIEPLARHHRTIAYSRRFPLRNTAIADDSDDPMQVHVDDLGAMISKLDAAPAHIIGHS